MTPSKQKILTASQARDLINRWKADGDTIVFTNGCFDILHLGHVDYLEKARNLGDRLIVGVNADKSVSRLKGKGRPVNRDVDRMHLLATLGFVDVVVRFDELTPLELIKKLLPDVLVKGKDYELSNIVGAETVLENGGRVETIDLVKGYSTTDLIKRIKDLKQK